jgi:hypothetical protein
MVAAETSDGGARWSAPVPVSADGWKIAGCPHSGAAVAVAGGELHVAWYSEAEGRGRLYWAKSPTTVLRFTPRRELSTGVADANHPALAVSGDEVFAAFEGRDANAREGWGAIGAWVAPISPKSGSPMRLANGPGSASYAQIAALGAGKWLIAWSANTNEGSAIIRSRVRRRE